MEERVVTRVSKTRPTGGCELIPWWSVVVVRRVDGASMPGSLRVFPFSCLRSTGFQPCANPTDRGPGNGQRAEAGWLVAPPVPVPLHSAAREVL